MRKLGVPYAKGYENTANKDLTAQADLIRANLLKDSVSVKPNVEVLALIAYLQRLGTDIEKK